MSGTPLPSKPKKHRQSKSNASPSPMQMKRQDQFQGHHHTQIQHQLPHNTAPNFHHQPSVPRSPAMATTPPHSPRQAPPRKRNRNKSRPGNVNVESANRPARGAPAFPESALDTPTRCYAGPTFHASPAPSNLPMPKALSKSVPSDLPDVMASLNLGDDTDSSSGSDAQTPPQGSPLDALFRADTLERSRSAQVVPKAPWVSGKDAGSPLPQRGNRQLLPSSPGMPQGQDLFHLDSDYENGKLLFAEKLRSAEYANKQSSSSVLFESLNSSAVPRKETRNSVKSYGMDRRASPPASQKVSSGPKEWSAPLLYGNRSYSPYNTRMTSSPYLTPPMSPANNGYAVGREEDQYNELRRMENDLRSILKIASPPALTAQTVVS